MALAWASLAEALETHHRVMGQLMKLQELEKLQHTLEADQGPGP